MDGKVSWEAAQREAKEIGQALPMVIGPPNTAIGQTTVAKDFLVYSRKYIYVNEISSQKCTSVPCRGDLV
jgi:hypothetical protein